MSAKRKEDTSLITGKGMLFDNLEFKDCHYAAILRSSFAHAKIKGIDVEAALNYPPEVSSETAPAAIAGAVNDALKPLGVEVTDLPLTPEKVWRMSHGKNLKPLT